MPRTTVNKALSHAIRSRYDLSNWRRSLRKIEEETKSIRYSVAINIGSNGRVNDGRVGVKLPRIERRLSTTNQPTNQPASQPVTKLLEGYGKRVENWNVGHRDCEQSWWSPRCSLCVCMCVSGYLSMAHKQVQVKERGGKQISDFVVEETETS